MNEVQPPIEKKVTKLQDLFDAIYGLEKLNMAYSVDTIEVEGEERHWIVKVST